MRALSATTNVVVGGTSTISSSFLSFARSAAEAATLSTSAGVERLRPHLEPPGLALGQGEHVAQVGVEQEGGAADATDQLVVGIGRGAAPHRQDVEGGDDALQGGAQFVADFGEEGAAGESGFVDGVEVGSLLFDSSNVVNSPNQGREKERKAQRHEQECKGEVGFMSPECAQR